MLVVLVAVVVAVGPVEGPWGVLQVAGSVSLAEFRVVLAAFGFVVVGGFGLAVCRVVAGLVVFDAGGASAGGLPWAVSAATLAAAGRRLAWRRGGLGGALAAGELHEGRTHHRRGDRRAVVDRPAGAWPNLQLGGDERTACSRRHPVSAGCRRGVDGGGSGRRKLAARATGTPGFPRMVPAWQRWSVSEVDKRAFTHRHPETTSVPPRIGHRKVHKLFNQLVPEIMGLVDIVVIGVVPQVHRFAIGLHDLAKRLDGFPEVAKVVGDVTPGCRECGTSMRLFTKSSVHV